MYSKAKRKTSICNIKLERTPGYIYINSVKTDFVNKDVERIFKLADLDYKDFTLKSFIKGGGKKSQYEAFLNSISKSILVYLKDNFYEKYIIVKKKMRDNYFVTVDHRQKQSKTPGKVKARKTRQFSKR